MRNHRLLVSCALAVSLAWLADTGAGCAHPAPVSAPPVAAPAPAARELTMDVISGIPMVELRIGESEPLSFIIDTGFDVNVLDIDVAKQLGLSVNATAKEKQPGGEVDTVDLGTLALLAGSDRISESGFIGMSIAGLGAVLGRPVAGILGHEFLARFVVDLDFRSQRMRLLDNRSYTYSGAGAVLPVKIVEDQVLVECELELPSGRMIRSWFKLDTGSLDVAGLALNFVRDERVVEPGMPELSVKGIAVGGETGARFIRARGFRMGNIIIDQPLLSYVVDAQGFENRANAGTVGSGVFARERLFLDYARNRIIVEGEGRARAGEEYMSGLLLISLPPAFSEVQIAQVFAGSAAERAGLQAGDIIVSVDGSRPELGSLRRLLQTPAPRVIHYRRGQDEATVTLQPMPLLPLLGATTGG